MKGTRPTKAELAYWDRLAEVVGCIACHLDGVSNHYVSIHHIDGRTKPGCHMNVLPLCAAHHQSEGSWAIAVHPFKARFEKRYGPQEYLKSLCDEIIK